MTRDRTALPALSRKTYRAALRELQIELVKLHRHVIRHGHKVLVILEGRDAAGKDGVIKRIVEHLSPREVRVVALGKPSDRERSQWYFQRFASQLPAAQEIVLFNRSWYNRAGVERVMGFCTAAQSEAFFETVPGFERMLIRSGIRFLKYYLDISRAEQSRRLKQRRHDPLSAWKISPIDAMALKHWDDYTRARNEMLHRTHHEEAPWIVVRADDKRQARLNLIRDLLSRIRCPGVRKHRVRPNPAVVRRFDPALVKNGWLAS
ncbi:MAG: polyphosphate kinase 2 [Nevskiales bacterium]|nr:polyphosphate kinase 2 [Nevskiales bacterium]